MGIISDKYHYVYDVIFKADVYLTFPEGPTQPSYTGRYSKKPEIEVNHSIYTS